MTKQIYLIALIGTALTGCAAQPKVALQTIKVPVPVYCQEPTPTRPPMPTKQLPPTANVDQYVQAAAAEIERREGYELMLRSALENCKRSDTSKAI